MWEIIEGKTSTYHINIIHREKLNNSLARGTLKKYITLKSTEMPGPGTGAGMQEMTEMCYQLHLTLSQKQKQKQKRKLT